MRYAFHTACTGKHDTQGGGKPDDDHDDNDADGDDDDELSTDLIARLIDNRSTCSDRRMPTGKHRETPTTLTLKTFRATSTTHFLCHVGGCAQYLPIVSRA